MINKIWNWIKNIFKSEKQDPHLTLYEEPVNRKLEKINNERIKIKILGEKNFSNTLKKLLDFAENKTSKKTRC